MKNKIKILGLAGILLFSPAIVSAKGNVRIWLDGKYLESDVAPYIKEDRTLVPVRVVSENLGYDVKWDSNEKKVTCSSNGKEMVMYVDNKNAKVDGSEKVLNMAPEITDDRVFIPLRDVSEIFGKEVEWDNDSRTVLIGDSDTIKTFKKEVNKEAVEKSNSPLVEKKTQNINGKRVNWAKFNLSNGDLKCEVVTANNGLNGDEAFSSMIARKKPLGAINGNFFDAYSTKEHYGPLISNGEVIQLSDSPSVFSVYEDGTFDISKKELKFDGFLDGKTKNEWNNDKGVMEFNTFTLWYVNTKPTDTAGIYKFTNKRGNSINLTGGSVVTIVNDKVTKVSDVLKNQKFDIPKNGYLIYFGKDSVKKDYITERFAVGRSVELKAKFDKDGKKVVQMIGAGPLLLQDGNITSAETLKEVKEAKISSNRGGRSAIGITKDGRIVMATVSSATVKELAAVMKELGCVSAMNVDGNASSALYVDGSIMQNAGRKLNNTFMIIKK